MKDDRRRPGRQPSPPSGRVAGRAPLLEPRRSCRMRNSLLNCVAMMAVFGVCPLARAQDSAADAAAPLVATPDVFTQTSVYGAPACAAPGYGAYPLQTGCPQCSRECCKDVWAGYCQEKNRSVWAAPCQGMCRPGCVRCFRVARCTTCTVVEAPGAAVAPLPAGVSPSASDQAPLVPSAPKPIAPKPQDAPIPLKPTLPKAQAETPAESAQMPEPTFNPAAWRIGRVVR
jgi:hypothetical protein